VNNQPGTFNDLASGARRGTALGFVARLGESVRILREDIDAKWLAGKWEGTAMGPGNQPESRDVIFMEDGTWTGDIQSRRVGWSATGEIRDRR